MSTSVATSKKLPRSAQVLRVCKGLHTSGVSAFYQHASFQSTSRPARYRPSSTTPGVFEDYQFRCALFSTTWAQMRHLRVVAGYQNFKLFRHLPSLETVGIRYFLSASLLIAPTGQRTFTNHQFRMYGVPPPPLHDQFDILDVADQFPHLNTFILITLTNHPGINKLSVSLIP